MHYLSCVRRSTVYSVYDPSYQEYPNSPFRDLDLLWAKGLSVSMTYREPPPHRFDEMQNRYVKNIRHCRFIYTVRGVIRSPKAIPTRGWRWERFKLEPEVLPTFVARVEESVGTGEELVAAITKSADKVVGKKRRFPGIRMRSRQRDAIRRISRTINTKRANGDNSYHADREELRGIYRKAYDNNFKAALKQLRGERHLSPEVCVW